MSRFESYRAALTEIIEMIRMKNTEGLASALRTGNLESEELKLGLAFAIEEDRAESIELIVANNRLSLEDMGGGMTPLGYALFNHSRNAARALCLLGADVNAAAQEDTGSRPLHLAIEMESMHSPIGVNGYSAEMTAFLLSLGANPLLEDRNGATAFDEARYGCHLNAYNLMLDRVKSQNATTLALRQDLDVSSHFLHEKRPGMVVIELVDREARGTGLMLSVTSDNRVIIKKEGLTPDQLWRIRASQLSERLPGGVHLVNLATGGELIQPNPTGEFLVGEAPPLRVGLDHPRDQLRACSWRLAKLGEDNQSNTLSIFDPELAYCVCLSQYLLKDNIQAVLWAWVGREGQRWHLRVVHP